MKQAMLIGALMGLTSVSSFISLSKVTIEKPLIMVLSLSTG